MSKGIMSEWKGSLSKIDAIKIIEGATDKDDPYWSDLVEDFYDEDTDTMPSIYHVYDALGVTELEYRESTGADGTVYWPSSNKLKWKDNPTEPGWYWLMDICTQKDPRIVDVWRLNFDKDAKLYTTEDCSSVAVGAEFYSSCQWSGPLVCPGLI